MIILVQYLQLTTEKKPLYLPLRNLRLNFLN